MEKENTFCLTSTQDDLFDDDFDAKYKDIYLPSSMPTPKITLTPPTPVVPKVEGHIAYIECDAQKHERYLRICEAVLDNLGGFIAGGCFKNFFSKEKPRDIDVYFETKQQFDNALLIASRNTSFRKHYSNDNVDAFIFTYKDNDYVVELVKKFFLTPKELLDRFDFTICKFAVYYKAVRTDPNNILTEKRTMCELYDPDFFEHLFLKKLVTDDNIVLPYNTFTRMIKYIRYGYLPCMETKSKIIEGLKNAEGELTDTSLYDGMD